MSNFQSGFTGLLPGNLISRLQRSLSHPSLVGEDASLNRYLKIQWCIKLWRFMVVAGIIATLLISPDLYASFNHSIAVMSLLLLYTIVYARLTDSPRFRAKFSFHFIDQCACSIFLLAAFDSALITSLLVFTFSSQIARPSIRIIDHLPGVILLSTAYMAALWLAPNDLFILSAAIQPPIVYSLLALSFFGFSQIIHKVSLLELEEKMHDQRKRYLRKLHDDLGNTLFGLHLKIQSMRFRTKQLSSSLSFLAKGFERAEHVLSDLINDMEEPDQDLTAILQVLKEQFAEHEFTVGLDLDDNVPQLPQEMVGELHYVIKESLTNILKHANTKKALVKLRCGSDKLSITIQDNGRGFNIKQIRRAPEESGLGILHMRERVELMNGELSVRSKVETGTSIEISINLRQKRKTGFAGFVKRFLPAADSQSDGGLYPFLVRIKVLIFFLTFTRWLTLPDSSMTNIVSILILSGVLLDTLIWLLLMKKVRMILVKHPWLLLFEQVFFGACFYMAWRSGVPLFFDDVPTYGLILSACFLTASQNIGLGIVQGLLISLIAAFDPAEARQQQLHDAVWNVTANLIFAMAAGLMVEFIKNLDQLKKEAVSRSMGRHRERLSAFMHRELADVLSQLSSEVSGLNEISQQGKAATIVSFGTLEKRSQDLRRRLRKTLNYLEEMS